MLMKASYPFTSRYVGIAVSEAMKSKYFMRLGCVIFKGKTIHAIGHNHANADIREIPMRYLKWKGSLHAEMSALFAAFARRRPLQGASLLVVRINNKNQFRMARPCKYCELAIRELTPIRKIYYSIDEYPYIERLKLC